MNERAKITASHLSRQAIVYLRQSSAAQVENNRKSTDRQYALAARARELGWPADRIVVIDEDLGLSGAGFVARSGFARLTAEVALAHVGLVLGLEVSRLARNNADWHRLIELGGLTDTLIGDADGIYTLNSLRKWGKGGCRGSKLGFLVSFMIRGGYLSAEDRADLIALARDGSAAHRLARRANSLVLLDDGWSCERVAAALLVDDETVRRWHQLFLEDGLEGLTRFDSGGSCPRLAEDQEAKLKSWIAAALPRSTRQVGAYIEREFGVVYESRSGLVAMLHRLGLEYHKPETIGRKLDAEKQQAFIETYENVLNSLGPDEAVLFVDAVHPTHAARPVGCWAPAKEHLAIEQTSGRQRLNIHGAIDLETGKTAMIDVETVDAVSTIRLLQAIEAMYPLLALIHVFLDNARYRGWRSPADASSCISSPPTARI